MEISEMRVRDIMLPRSQMVTVDRSDDLRYTLIASSLMLNTLATQ